MGVGGQRLAPASLISRKKPGTHRTGGWVDLGVNMDGCGKSRPLPPHRDSILGRPARSESLYRLNYPGPQF